MKPFYTLKDPQSNQCPICSMVRPKQASDAAFIERSLRKAKSGEYKYVLFGSNTVSNQEGLFSLLDDFSLKPAAQICLACNPTEVPLHFFHQIQSRSGLIDVLLSDSSQIQLLNRYINFDFANLTFFVHTRFDLQSALSNLPTFWHKRLRLYFPHTPSCHFYRPLEIFELLKICKQKFTWLEIRPPLVELFDPCIPDDLELEPLSLPEIDCEHKIELPSISVIIPTYNNKLYLMNTVKHLSNQTMSAKDYEIIIVDDGSSDGTITEIKKMKAMKNLKYIHIPRSQPRQMGDGRYRAGIARNLGVKHARGEILLFLDSDILIPRNYLEDLIEKHETWDLIQSKRYQLKPECSSGSTQYQDIIIGRDTYVAPGAYWETFQDKTPDWMALKGNWKYISSFCLSVKKEIFKSVGWFKKIYVYYGFEDTDLGFRIVKNKHRILLNNVPVYHLAHKIERSEFHCSYEKKIELLKRTAKIFYQHNLNEEIYEELNTFLT